MKKPFFLIILVILSNIAFASYISLTTSIETVLIEDTHTKTNITILNSGDEPASNVKLFLVLPEEFRSNTIFIGELKPNEPFTGQFNVSVVSNVSAGIYPLAILIEYSDMNGYGFSSVSPNTIIYKNPSSTKISGLIEELKLSEKGNKNLVLRVLNRDTREHNIKVQLYLPNELTTNENDKTVLIKPNEEKQIIFQVSNFGALLGSSYAVFASLEHEDEMHYTSIARGVIKIEKEDYSWILISGILIMFAIFIIINIKYKFLVKK